MSPAQEQALRTLLQRHRKSEMQIAVRVRKGEYSRNTLTQACTRNEDEIIKLVKGILK